MPDTLIQQQLSSKISIHLIALIWTMDILHEPWSSLQTTELIAAKWNKRTIICEMKMHILSFWCCTMFALRPSHCISCIIQRQNTYEIHETAAEICCKSVKIYEYIFHASWMNCAISGSCITCNLVVTCIAHPRGKCLDLFLKSNLVPNLEIAYIHSTNIVNPTLHSFTIFSRFYYF